MVIKPEVSQLGRMDDHKNARSTVHSRERLARIVLERGYTLKAAAGADFTVTAHFVWLPMVSWSQSGAGFPPQRTAVI